MRAWLTRRLGPVNSMRRPWWTMRSMIAAASLSSAKIVPHLLNSMFVAEDDAATFVAAGDDLVEETGPVEAHGRVAELVEDDQVGTGEVFEQVVEGAVAFGLAQLEDELGGLMEPHAQPHVDRLHAQPDREMCLSAPGLAVEHQVLRARDETEP